VTFERRAGAERHHRRTVTSGSVHHGAHFFGGQRKHNDIRFARLVPGLAVTMLLELCGRGGAAVTEARAKISNESRARVSREN
jgi:hypothetical protein